jgi:hypothetical protein
MGLRKARHTITETQPGKITYRQQYVRCGKAACSKCTPPSLGHGPYWYAFYWGHRQRTRSLYVGKDLPGHAKLIQEDEPGSNEAAGT